MKEARFSQTRKTGLTLYGRIPHSGFLVLRILIFQCKEKEGIPRLADPLLFFWNHISRCLELIDGVEPDGSENAWNIQIFPYGGKIVLLPFQRKEQYRFFGYIFIVFSRCTIEKDL